MRCDQFDTKIWNQITKAVDVLPHAEVRESHLNSDDRSTVEQRQQREARHFRNAQASP